MIKRRTFIRNTGILSAGALILPSCTSGPGNQSETQADVEIGIQLYTVRNELRNDIEGTLKSIAEIGYDYVEVFGYDNGRYYGKPASVFYTMLEDNGLKIRSGHYHTGISEPDVVGTVLNGWDQAIDDALKAKQGYMVMSWLPDSERSWENYERMPDMFNTAGEKCKAAGIQFCYHNHDFEFEKISEEIPMYYLLDNTDPDLMKMELDLYWITKAGLDPVSFFEKYPGRTPLWHVKDMDNTAEQNFTEVGNGIIDFQKIFKNADNAGMQSFFVEQDQSEDPLGSIRISYGNVRKLT